MSKILVVVESPAKAKTIGKFLGKKYMVKASMGHVRDLPKSQFGIDMENGLALKYITIRGKGPLLQELKTLAKKSSAVLLATDPDREGEAIAWHLGNVLEMDLSEACRIEFNEITKKAISEAIKKPRPIDLRRVESQQARRVLDRIVGYKLSPLLWKKVRKGLSAGRVQSFAVRLICDREEEILEFVPQEYWEVKAHLVKDKDKIIAKLTQINGKKAELNNSLQVEEIKNKLNNENIIVKNIEKRKQRRNPAPPFTTSSMQQEAFRKLNFTAKRTMMVAQQLYEGLDLSEKEGTVGLITYIRTDSTRISEEAQREAAEFIQKHYGAEFLPETPRTYTNKGKAQDSHEAIRPSQVSRTPADVKPYLTADQYKLYKLIWERFVASQMSSLVQDVTTVDFAAGEYTFRTNGVVVTFPGFTKVYEESKDNGDRDGQGEEEKEGLLPELAEGESLPIKKLEGKQHFTQPKPRYTEATLIKTLEEMGIGRPSTYAPILDTIVSRGYVIKEKKMFMPTELGVLVLDLLKKYFPNIVDKDFTANMELQLDEIEAGNIEWKKLIMDFYEPFMEDLKVAEDEIGEIELEDEVSDVICEKCGHNMVIKHGRFGKFLACPNFPECRNTKPILETLDVKCPKCGEGKVVVRYTKRKRKFYGCSRYPECEYTSWNEPTDKRCSVCGGVLEKRFRKNGEERLVCANESCKYTIVEKINSDEE